MVRMVYGLEFQSSHVGEAWCWLSNHHIEYDWYEPYNWNLILVRFDKPIPKKDFDRSDLDDEIGLLTRKEDVQW